MGTIEKGFGIVAMLVFPFCLFAQESVLKSGRGETFIKACESLLQPMHSPPARVFDTANRILLERLPSLEPDERKACLRALVRTADSDGLAAAELGEAWLKANDDDRYALVLPFITAMLRAKRFEKSEAVWAFLSKADYYPLDEFAFSAIDELSKKSPPSELVVSRLVSHSKEQFAAGRIDPFVLGYAFRFVGSLGVIDPTVELLVRASTSNIDSVTRLTEVSASVGLIKLLIGLMSDEKGEVREIARKHYNASPKALKDALDPDVYYFEQFHTGSIRDWLGEQTQRRDRSIVYFRFESMANARELVDRLRTKKLFFSKDDIRILKNSEFQDNVLEMFLEK